MIVQPALSLSVSDRCGFATPINPLPPRLQRSRKRGTTTPPGAVYVGRPTLWGNPFAGAQFGHAKAARLFQRWVAGNLGAIGLERIGFSPAEAAALTRRRQNLLHHLPSIAGRPLQCWCPASSQWCHAETLLHMANAK